MDIMGQAYLHNGQFEEALAWRNKAQSQSGEGVFWGYGHEVSILGHLGRLDEAKVALAELLRLNPEFTCEFYRENYPVTDDGYNDLYIDGLRKAGVPEG